MAVLRLSDRDLRRLASAQERLLASLEYESREAWALEALRAVKELLGCDIGSFVSMSGGGPSGVTEDFDPALFDVFARFDEDDLDYVRGLAGALAERRYVWTAASNIYRHTGRVLEDTRVYQEFMSPAGVHDGAALQVPLPGGAAVLALARSGAAGRRGYDRELQMLSMLVAAFRVGAAMRVRFEGMQAGVGALLDILPGPVGVWTRAGRELIRNVALVRLLAGDPEGDRIVQAMEAAARASVGRADDVDRDSCCVRVTTANGRYAIGAGHVGPGTFGPAPTVLVSVQRLGLVLPDVAELQAVRHLSRREAEVAILLARGASNKVIARELGVRASTVRTLVERTLTKLGVHSRKALALKLTE
jgi:two-component system nitrate/nitrite response regulator NarL